METETITKVIPNPGSEEALNDGCVCPVIDNHYGKGFSYENDDTPHFWYTGGCPVHNPDNKYGIT